MRRLVLAAGIAMAVTGSASAELVARVPDGMLAVTPSGAPLVAYVRGSELVIAQRPRPGRWTQRAVTRVAGGSRLVAFKAGPAGPVAVVVGPGDRTLLVVRRQGARWRASSLAGRLDADVSLGWPGLALDARGLPVLAFTRWHSRSLNSQLILAKLDRHGAPHTQRVTAGGFPKSYTAPPAAPVLMANGSVHVVESYGVSGAVGTIEWLPRNRTWIGLYLSAGRGGFPIGPLFAARGRGTVVYATWSEEFPGSLFGGFPVTLARHGNEIREEIVSERGLTAGLAMTAHGPEVATNDWVSADAVSFSFPNAETLSAATVSGGAGSELDGRIAGLAAVRGGAQDLLISRAGALSWFRTRTLPVHVALRAEQQADGIVAFTGHVEGAHGGHVTIYREQTKDHRDVAANVRLGAGGEFSFTEPVRSQPTFYRAVYVDPTTGIPYAKLLRDPIPAPPQTN